MAATSRLGWKMIDVVDGPAMAGWARMQPVEAVQAKALSPLVPSAAAHTLQSDTLLSREALTTWLLVFVEISCRV
jgi:hypothetical protein